MTTNLIDIQNSDVIMCTNDMAENHPVGFQWVMKAKERGAKVIHVDPRFTRTSAVADVHVPLRAGSDIAFLGGIVNYVIQHDRWFHDYVLHYTNASIILREDFRDTEDLDGLFSGFSPEDRHYDPTSWQYEGAEVAASAGERDQEYGKSVGHREAGRGESTGGAGSAIGHGDLQ